jgi:hypothetical protein
MMIKFSFQNRIWLLSLCLLLVLMFSCESKDKYAGVYKAEAKDTSKQAEIAVELKANGDGLWRVGNEEVSFSWDIKGGELRVNTKGGGVIVGKIEKDTIQMTLPNMKTLTFKKIQ